MAETKKALAAPTKLSELAKATRLTGKVCITDAKGITNEYEDETVAYEVWKDRIGNLEHRRGAFFEVASAAPATPTPAAPADDSPKAKKPKA